MKCTEYTLPAHWASALINADTSGMTDEEEQKMNEWLDEVQPGYCIGCSDESFFTWRNDATQLGGDCLTYTFQEVV